MSLIAKLFRPALSAQPPASRPGPPTAPPPSAATEPGAPGGATSAQPNAAAGGASAGGEPAVAGATQPQGASAAPAPDGPAQPQRPRTTASPRPIGTPVTASAERLDFGATEGMTEDAARARAIAAQSAWRLNEIVGALGAGATGDRFVASTDRPEIPGRAAFVAAVKILRGDAASSPR